MHFDGDPDDTSFSEGAFLASPSSLDKLVVESGSILSELPAPSATE